MKKTENKSADTPAERMKAILPLLKQTYPKAICALKARKPWQVLISTILSAQTTDAAVNRVTPELFRQYPSIRSLATAKPEAIEPLIKSIGLYRNKSENIIAAAKIIRDRFHGRIPRDLPALTTLPGVGRKTANCVLVNAFGLPGIMCDTHCCRCSRRIGLSASSHPDQVEKDLAGLMPETNWGPFSHRIILHGRNICHARKPQCPACPLRPYCQSAENLSSAETPGL